MDPYSGRIYKTQAEVDAASQAVRDRLVTGPEKSIRHLSRVVRKALTKNQAKAARRKARGK